MWPTFGAACGSFLNGNSHQFRPTSCTPSSIHKNAKWGHWTAFEMVNKGVGGVGATGRLQRPSNSAKAGGGMARVEQQLPDACEGMLGVGLAARPTGAQVETLTASPTAFTRRRNACNPLKNSARGDVCIEGKSNWIALLEFTHCSWEITLLIPKTIPKLISFHVLPTSSYLASMNHVIVAFVDKQTCSRSVRPTRVRPPPPPRAITMTTSLARGLFGHERRMRRFHVVQLSAVRCDVAIDFYTVSRAAQRSASATSSRKIPNRKCIKNRRYRFHQLHKRLG